MGRAGLGIPELVRELEERTALGLKLPQMVYCQIKRHAYDETPKECCGLIACLSNRAMRAYPVSNVSADPVRTFDADSGEVMEACAAITKEGWELWGSYHSHTFSGPQLSIRDRKQLWTNHMHLVVGMNPGLEMRAYAIWHDHVDPVPVRVLG